VSFSIPKLFTDFRGASIVKNIGFNFRERPARSTSFLDRTVAARRPEKPFESATGIIPGDRGKVGDSWCRPPLRHGASRCWQADLTSSSDPESCPVSSHEPGAERQAAIRNRPQAESRPQDVSTCARTQLPQRVLVATAQDQNAVAFPGGTTPPEGPACSHRQGAQGRRDCGERASLAKPANLLDWGGVKNRVTPLQKRKQPES